MSDDSPAIPALQCERGLGVIHTRPLRVCVCVAGSDTALSLNEKGKRAPLCRLNLSGGEPGNVFSVAWKPSGEYEKLLDSILP